MDTYKLEYKKWHIGIPKIVVKMYNISRKQAEKLCNVHYTQFWGQNFVENAEACILPAKTIEI